MRLADLTIHRLLDTNVLREPILRRAIEGLQLPAGSHGLDVGCGIGLQALLLAQAVGPAGRVTGVDIDPALVTHAREHAGPAIGPGRVTFAAGDMHDLPFARGSFDWAWSADCVGYPAGELRPLLAELSRVVRPGGSVAILGWTSQQVLPGYPELEARLNASCSAYRPFLGGVEPDQHFVRALRGFGEAGLLQVEARTFVGEARAPLTDRERDGLTSLIAMLWAEPTPSSSAEGIDAWRESRRLCQPGSPEFILDVPGYYAFFTVSLFRGFVPRRPEAEGGSRRPPRRTTARCP